jgi:hypothetical protein
MDGVSKRASIGWSRKCKGPKSMFIIHIIAQIFMPALHLFPMNDWVRSFRIVYGIALSTCMIFG